MQTSEAMQQAAVKPENAELVRNLGSLVVHIMKTCSRGMLEAVDRLGLSLSQVKALQALATADGLEMSLKEMGDALGLSLPAISRAVDGLVQRELVTRTEDPNDRRSKRVAATAAGRALLDELTVLRLADLEAFVETLSPRERRQLEQAVTSIVTARALPPLSPRKE